MAPRTLAVLAVLMTGCFVDQPGQPTGGTGTTGAASSTSGPGTGEPGTSGTSGPVHGTGTGDGSTSGATTGPGDPTTSAAADPTTTTTPMTSDPTMGSICPPADGFPNIDPQQCRECMAASCCAQVGECAADPACSGAWSCTQGQPCITQWQNCPGYAEHSAKLDAISGCGEAACASVCSFGPCAAEEAACEANPECQAVDACAQANCNMPCPPEDPECILPCWGMCQAQHPDGADQWGALIMCYGSKCG